MKKVIVILVILCLVAGNGVAEQTEVQFCNIPWLSNEITSLQMLKFANLCATDESINLIKKGKGNYIVEDSEGIAFYHNDEGNAKITGSIVLNELARGKVAGYPVNEIELTFAYDGTFKLIATRIDLVNAKYDLLKEKLSKKYGTPVITETEEGIESIVWKGNNNSGILLYTQDKGKSYDFVYGRFDAETILQNCLVEDEDANNIL